MPFLSGIINQVAKNFNEAKGEPHTALVQLIRGDNVRLSKEVIDRLGFKKDSQKSTMQKINAVINDIYRAYPGEKYADERRFRTKELNQLISFIADHENEIENARSLRGNQSNDFNRRNDRIEQSVRDVVNFLTQAPIQVKMVSFQSKEAEKEKADELPLKEAPLTEEQAQAQKALEKARSNLKALLEEEIKKPTPDSRHIDSAVARFRQNKPPHLVQTERDNRLPPHERIDSRTGQRDSLIWRLIDLVFECHPADRLVMFSILVGKNNLTDSELISFLDKIKKKDESLYNEINGKGLVGLDDQKTGEKKFSLDKMLETVLGYNSQDRYRMFSFFAAKNNLTEVEVRSFLDKVKEKDECLYNEINEKGVMRLDTQQTREFLEANGREVSAQLTNEQLALGQHPKEVLRSKINS